MPKILLSFQRGINAPYQPDVGERLGNVGLGLLRIGVGKTFEVSKQGHLKVRSQIYSLKARIAAVALFVLASPITIPLAGIGYIGTTFSKTHQEIFTTVNKIATTLQKNVRRYRVSSAHLPRNNFLDYREACTKTKNMPEAEGGNTHVYLPPNIPHVVLKKSGKPQAVKRFHQMQDARSTLHSQNSRCLVIPKANLCGGFLVEERLPINISQYHNMELYHSQPQLFDQAVLEMVRFFSKKHMTDLIQLGYSPLGRIEGVRGNVRFDNLPLYVVEEKGRKIGKIGLIDLEHMIDGPHPDGLPTLAKIFPYHLNQIIAEAQRLDMKIDQQALTKAAEEGNIYIQKGFVEHLAWLQHKNISQNVLDRPFVVNPERKPGLHAALKAELLKLNQGNNDYFRKMGYTNPEKDFFKGNPEEIAATLAKALTDLYTQELEGFINTYQREQLAKKSGNAPMSNAELVEFRSPRIMRNNLILEASAIIGANKSIQFSRFLGDSREMAEQLFCVFMKELERSGDIAHFDPGYYTGGHNISWMRY